MNLTRAQEIIIKRKRAIQESIAKSCPDFPIYIKIPRLPFGEDDLDIYLNSAEAMPFQLKAGSQTSKESPHFGAHVKDVVGNTLFYLNHNVIVPETDKRFQFLESLLTREPVFQSLDELESEVLEAIPNMRLKELYMEEAKIGDDCFTGRIALNSDKLHGLFFGIYFIENKK